MYRLAPIVVAAMAASAAAKPRRDSHSHAPATIKMPAVGDEVTALGQSGWPRLDWLYGAPVEANVGGKIVLHWFCTPKDKSCSEDLERVTKLAQHEHVYVVAHIAGTKADAKKLDPIGKAGGPGTVSFGKGTTTLMKQLRIATPTSIVVDVDGKAALVATTHDDLDGRDAKVDELTKSIKDFVVSTSPSPASAKPGEKVELTVTAQAASWLAYASKPASFKLQAVPALACDSRELAEDRIHVDGRTLTATVTCSAPAGVYDIGGELKFDYKRGDGTVASETQEAKWTLQVEGAQTRVAAETKSEPEVALPAAAPVRSKPSRWFALLSLGTPLYGYARPVGKPGMLTFTPDTQVGFSQVVGVGYVLNPRMAIGVYPVFAEVLRNDNGATGWSFGSVNIVGSLRFWRGLYIGEGPMIVYRRFLAYQNTWGLYTELGYRVMAAGWVFKAGIASPQVYTNTVTVGFSSFFCMQHSL